MQVVVPEEYKYLFVQDEDRPVVKVPADVLLQTATPIERVTKRYQIIADNMVRIMRQARGIGLAAPQIGISERLIVVAPDDKPIVIYNPVVSTSSGSQIGEEGCLSIPGLYGDVERPDYAEITGLDRKGRESTWDMEGIAARVVLHEIDHLNGVLFTELVDPATLYWQHPSDHPSRDE